MHTPEALDLLQNHECQLNIYIPPNTAWYVDPDETSEFAEKRQVRLSLNLILVILQCLVLVILPYLG